MRKVQIAMETKIANAGPERSCTKTNCNAESFTNIGRNSNLNSRLCNAFLPLVNNNEIKYFLPGQSRESDRKARHQNNKTITKGV